MARALLPASFAREAPDNQSGVPVTATGHCPVPVLPRKAKTSFPGRGAAPLRFAASSAWSRKVAGPVSAPPVPAPSRCATAEWPRARLGLRDRHSDTAHHHTQQDGRAAPATPATGLRRPPRKTEPQEQPAGNRLPPLPLFLCAGVHRKKGPVPPPHSRSLQRTRRRGRRREPGPAALATALRRVLPRIYPFWSLLAVGAGVAAALPVVSVCWRCERTGRHRPSHRQRRPLVGESGRLTACEQSSWFF